MRKGRGRNSHVQAETTGTKVEKVEHYTVVRQPEGKYETHFTPSSGSGHDIGLELASVVRNLY